MLKHGANVYINENTVGNSLHLAAERGHTEVIKLLVEHVAEQDRYEFLIKISEAKFERYIGKTAHEIALLYDMKETATLIENYLKETSKQLEPQAKRTKTE